MIEQAIHHASRHRFGIDVRLGQRHACEDDVEVVTTDIGAPSRAKNVVRKATHA
jgi:hypothetical protein